MRAAAVSAPRTMDREAIPASPDWQHVAQDAHEVFLVALEQGGIVEERDRRGGGQVATAANVAEFEAIRAELENAAVDALVAAEARKQAIEALGAIEVTAKVGSEGKLFGSIGVADVCEAIEGHGQTVEKSEIRMPEGALRSVGEHLVDIHLYTDVDTQVTVNIIGEE